MNKLRRNLFFKMENTCRCYSRNVLRRKPIKVLNVPEDSLASIQNEARYPKLKLSNHMDNTSLEVSIGSETKLIPYYEKLQKSDPRFTKTISLIKNRQMREINGKILLEGKRLINDAIDAGMELKSIYFSREKDLAEINFRRAAQKVEFFKVLYRTMQMWSDLKTCPGVMGIFKRPCAEDVHMLSEPVLPVNIICDNIKDPGNLGSIIRNAASAGCQNILLMKGCVDPWEAKVLKTGCGGHFRIPIISNIEWTLLSNYISRESHIFIADNSDDIEKWKQTPEFINYDESIEEIDDTSEDTIKKYATVNEHNQIIHIDETLQEPTELEMLETTNLPCYLYSSIKFPKKNIVLYVGGDTNGLDNRIVRLAYDYGGKKIKIPLENNMDNLNSSFSLTIILYEIKRQLTERYVTK
ncbi:rRNA methyltransferase 3, mitochondrial [Parasteatoda tepidariorum]|uniref:rRNA methyltransferase 3, mitochondrial n=1 Tax=Parasteatoda tepidariorum TaxID=114398 RepID=UPI001C71A723|nr:rRNA methyltransferase 3, mitochondrial [Parasteatoda tepidariorum]